MVNELISEDLFIFDVLMNAHLSESLEMAIYKHEEAKRILQEKLKNAHKDSKPYLQKQITLLDTRRKDLENKAKFRERDAAENHEEFMNNQMDQDPYVQDAQQQQQLQQPQQQMVQQQPEVQQSGNDFDPNNPDHTKIIKGFHKHHMEKVRQAKQEKINSAIKENEESNMLLMKLANEKLIADRDRVQKIAATNLRLMKQRATANMNYVKK